MASSSGTPAASSVPNASSSTISVSGSEVSSAFCRSFWKIFVNPSSELTRRRTARCGSRDEASSAAFTAATGLVDDRRDRLVLHGVAGDLEREQRRVARRR